MQPLLNKSVAPNYGVIPGDPAAHGVQQTDCWRKPHIRSPKQGESTKEIMLTTPDYFSRILKNDISA